MKIPPIFPKTASILLALAGSVSGLQADTITGIISFSGTTTIDSSSFVTGTRFTSFQNVFVGAPSALTGDYLGTSSSAVTMTPFTWMPATASTPINPLWTFLSGGLTYSFNLSALHEDYASPTGLLLSGLGTAYITGVGVDKKMSDGSWNFSAQTLGFSTFTFSSSTASSTDAPAPLVSDGGSTAILLSGALLLGLGVVGRKPFDRKVAQLA